MIKLTCPSCQAKLQLKNENIPATGGWANCPKCRDRFFINPGGHQVALDLSTPPEDTSAKVFHPQPDHNQAAQTHIPHYQININNSPKPDKPWADFDPAEIIVIPATVISPAVSKYIALALLGLPLIAIFLILYWGREMSLQQPETQAPAPIKQINAEGSITTIQADLRNIKNGLLRRRRPFFNVDYSGPESRVFKYFMARLTPPSYCQGIEHIEVSVLSPTVGYEATGFCSNHIGHVARLLKMQVNWTNKGAKIQFANYNDKEDFAMYPQIGD